MRSVTAGSAPGGTSSPLTATASTEKNSDARAASTSLAASSAPSAARSTSLSRDPSGSSRTRTRPSTANTTYTGAGSRSASRRRPAALLERLAESALTRGESHVGTSRASPRGRPKGTLSSWLGHSGSCVGNGHGHGHGAQSVSDASSRAAAAANRSRSRSNRSPPRHRSSRSCPCQLSTNRAHATCWSTAACDVDPSPDSLYLQCAAKPYSAATCISRVRICTSYARPSSSRTTACRDRYPLRLAFLT